MIIAIVHDIHTRFPAVSTRQWNFWVRPVPRHLRRKDLILVLVSRVRFRSLLGNAGFARSTQSMSTFVLAQLDAAVDLFTSLIQHGANTPRYCSNLQWLLKLRARASSKVSAVTTAQTADSQRDTDPERQRSGADRKDSEDVELLGWRTRLIERAGREHQTIRTIQLTEMPAGSHGTNIPHPPPNGHHAKGHQGELGLDDTMMPGSSLPLVTPDSTDELVSPHPGF